MRTFVDEEVHVSDVMLARIHLVSIEVESVVVLLDPHLLGDRAVVPDLPSGAQRREVLFEVAIGAHRAEAGVEVVVAVN